MVVSKLHIFYGYILVVKHLILLYPLWQHELRVQRLCSLSPPWLRSMHDLRFLLLLRLSTVFQLSVWHACRPTAARLRLVDETAP